MTATDPVSRSVFARRLRGSASLPGPVASSDLPLADDVDGERGFVIGRRLSGERALPVSAGLVLLSQERLRRHVVVCGATGSGKTETLLRLAWLLAKCSDAPVFYLDGKGDKRNAERFSGVMTDAGRKTRVFPIEPFDGWRGEAARDPGRMMEIVDYSSEGPAAWYGMSPRPSCGWCVSTRMAHHAQ